MVRKAEGKQSEGSQASWEAPGISTCIPHCEASTVSPWWSCPSAWLSRSRPDITGSAPSYPDGRWGLLQKSHYHKYDIFLLFFQTILLKMNTWNSLKVSSQALLKAGLKPTFSVLRMSGRWEQRPKGWLLTYWEQIRIYAWASCRDVSTSGRNGQLGAPSPSASLTLSCDSREHQVLSAVISGQPSSVYSLASAPSFWLWGNWFHSSFIWSKDQRIVCLWNIV